MYFIQISFVLKFQLLFYLAVCYLWLMQRHDGYRTNCKRSKFLTIPPSLLLRVFYHCANFMIAMCVPITFAVQLRRDPMAM